MHVLTKTSAGIILVASKDRRLLGVIKDIDIRRSLLKGAAMDTPVAEVMNQKPLTVPEGMTQGQLTRLFLKTGRSHIPIVDKRGRLKSLAAMLDYVTIPKTYPNWIVIMAGGAGKRLRPLTADVPKPMLPMGGKPLLQLLLEQLTAFGFTNFIFTVNYLAGHIRSHFGDGSRWGARIEYVHESEPLGTAGALGLIRRRFQEPLLVLNGDILTKVNFNALLDFHVKEKSLATLCVKRHEVQVPYGVIDIKKRRLNGFIEKPVHQFLINAGIYVLDPKVLGWLKRGHPCGMPELLEKVRHKRADGVSCFPIEEYWIDIGGPRELERAVSDFAGEFQE